MNQPEAPLNMQQMSYRASAGRCGLLLCGLQRKHLDNFLQGKCFHKAENAFQEFVESRDMDFYDTGINKLTSH